MKKVIFGLAALLMCFFMVSCSTDYVQKKKNLYEKAEKKGNDWKVDDWKDFAEDLFELELKFIKSDPTEEEFKKVAEVELDRGKLSGDALKAMRAGEEAFKADNKDKIKEAEEEFNKYMEKHK